MSEQEWFLRQDDGHFDLNTRGWGEPIPAPPLEVQVLIRQKERIDAVLIAYATMASNQKHGEDFGATKYFRTRFEEYLSNEAPYSRGTE